MQDSAFSLIPPIVAIVIAIWRKNALIALYVGLLTCTIMLADGQLFVGLGQSGAQLIDVFASTGNIYIVSFSLMIGALVTLMNQSGAVNGFIQFLSHRNVVKNSRQAALLPTLVGTSIFTDTNLSMFTSGMAAQKLFDSHKLSRARLAYLIDSTCAPISILFLINGWGAYVLGLLDNFDFSDPVGLLIGTIGYNFYAIIAVALAYYTAYSGKVYGPLKYAESIKDIDSNDDVTAVAPSYVMWLPLLCLLSITLLLLWVTGEGDMRRGSGSFSVFWAITSSLVILISLILSHRLLTTTQVILYTLKGVRYMAPAVAILVLSFAFGDAIKSLGTGHYVSQLLTVEFPQIFIAPILFVVAGIMAFATGTSWGTFAILIPIAVPIALQTGMPVEFLVAAVLGGGIFGDHASPISDTTVVASIASGCDHFEHVKTQLPYALAGGIATIVLYIAVGLLL